MRRSLCIEELEALPVGSVIEDRHHDRATRGTEGMWEFPETVALSTAYVHKHYSPCVLISEGKAYPVNTDTTADAVSVPPLDLPARVSTEAEALTLIQQMRTHFGLVGTEFTPEDVSPMVAAVLGNLGEDVERLLTPAVTTAVLQDSRWAGLRDALSEHGNNELAALVSDVAGALAWADWDAEDGTRVKVSGVSVCGHQMRVTTATTPERLVEAVKQTRAAEGVAEVLVEADGLDGAVLRL